MTTTTADQVLATIDDHESLHLTKGNWCCKCGTVLEPYRDFKPADQRLHRRHLAGAIAEQVAR